ncbi:MAG: glycosyl hydrolase family 28 protein [Bacteroidota bacterium]
MRGKLLFALIATGLTIHSPAQKIYNIEKLGAKGDGQTSNTLVIQQAIDDAHANGGGTIVIPAGKFVTGVIELKSNVIIQLNANASLLGSTKRIDYGPKNASALIVANDQHHIGITGKGTISGQGPDLLKDIYRMLNNGTLEDKEWKTENPWHQTRPEERNRPKIIEFKNCDTITIKGISIKDGLCWVQNYKNCSNIIIDSIRVESNVMWNNDGIDITDCKNVRLTNSFFNADDDGICLKSEERNRRCENIYIANCTIRSSASALKFGTASRGGFKNITIRNIKIYDTYRSAIALESVDGGILEDVDIRNVTATNTGNAIFIRLGHRNRDSVISKLRRVYIGNVKVFVPKDKADKGYPMEGPPPDFRHNIFPSSISGLPGHPVENIVLENIDIIYPGGASKDSAYVPLDSLTSIPNNANAYPEFSMFGELPAWAFYARHITGLTMKNIKLSSQKEDFRSAMLFDDINGLTLRKIQVATGKHLPFLVMNNTKKLMMNTISLPTQDKGAVLITK